MYLGSMLLLTMDRVLAITLNLRYAALVTKRKIIFSIILWVLCSIFYLVIALLYKVNGTSLMEVNIMASLIFTVTVSGSYLLIVRKMLKSKRNLRKITPNGSTLGSNTTREQIKTKKAIIAPFFIVFTFVLFWVIPFQITYWCNRGNIYAPQLFLHPIGFISDAIIYIFFYPPAFKELKRLLEALR